MISLNFNNVLRGPVSKYSHIEVMASTFEFGGDIIQSIAVLLLSEYIT